MHLSLTRNRFVTVGVVVVMLKYVLMSVNSCNVLSA